MFFPQIEFCSFSFLRPFFFGFPFFVVSSPDFPPYVCNNCVQLWCLSLSIVGRCFAIYFLLHISLFISPQHFFLVDFFVLKWKYILTQFPIVISPIHCTFIRHFLSLCCWLSLHPLPNFFFRWEHSLYFFLLNLQRISAYRLVHRQKFLAPSVR